MEKLLVVVLALDVRVEIAVVVGANIVVRAAARSLIDGSIFLAVTTLCGHNSYLVAHSHRGANFCLYLGLEDDSISLRRE